VQQAAQCNNVTHMSADEVAARARLMQAGQRFAFPVPDGLMAAVFALAAVVDFLPSAQLALFSPAFLAGREDLMFALFVEGGFLMMQGTLVDIATRLKKRPPIWAVPIIGGVVLLFSEYARGVLVVAWERGTVVFVPLLFSLIERAMVLWYLPDRTRAQKLAARALISNRMATGLVLLGVYGAVTISGVVFRYYDFVNRAWLSLGLGAVYFAVAAFDRWRVLGPRFAERPSVLFGFDLIHLDLVDDPVL
jgi:hypothetical protein